ncbi:NTPase [Massilia dura]|uniref:NTPase n=2 Tax=Pseudoduganella dura TaxID=321982 RepID=A0A6I3XR65_9BURK|nr:NTPase [Pseudoduganella dura]
MGSDKSAKRMTGGSAAERGLDFQARVSAIVMANLLTERPIGWLEGVLDDTPLELHAETGGPGDDVRFSTKGGRHVELQAKRGLQRGDDLWCALTDLSKGISDGTIDAGILAVCPNSSGTIRENLAEDIVRLGTGRADGLREIGDAWVRLLSSLSLDATLVCRHLRIVVVSAVDGNREAEVTASERLSRVIEDPGTAWPVLVEYGRLLIRRRERSRPEDIYQTLSLAHVKLKTTEVDTRVQLTAAMHQWLRRTYANMTVIGVHSQVSFDKCWIELDAQAMDEASTEQEDLDKALRRYHEYGGGRSSASSFDSATIARFVRKCVVVGGPGMGKSTLLKKLALDYSADGFLTLLVRLPQVVALLIREGRRFEECLMEVALSGSGFRIPVVSLEGSVILCDALDECGSQQPLVTAKLHAFTVAHPRARVVVTSRPIGYRPGELAGWRHYELQPLNDMAAEKAVSKVIEAIPFSDGALRSRATKQAIAQLGAKTIKGAAARSPLMITLVAALSIKGVDPGLGKGTMYRNFFQLLQNHPPTRLTERSPSEPERNRFLDMLGWCLLSQGNEPAERILSQCARWWSEETGQSAFVSETKIAECLEYWECLGVVERVRTHTLEAITFVHKTFGEFAAARHISKGFLEVQRENIARAIQTPDWKETLSFASHLGLTSLILKVWTELAESGETKAISSLDDAVELVIQAGMPLASDALASFAQCCWRAVENTASRVRYVAGEALCLVSKDHWSVIEEATLARLESSDGWSRLVAWASLCVSNDQKMAITTLTEAIPRLVDSRPTDSHLGGFSLQPSGNGVWQHLVLGAARRVLIALPDPKAVQILNELIGDAKGLSVSTVGKLRTLFKHAGLELSRLLDETFSGTMTHWASDREALNREAAYLLELIDDPLIASDEADLCEPSLSLELGACMTVICYREMPLEDNPSSTSSAKITAARRRVIHALARSAGLDHAQLVRQARSMKRMVLDDVENERFGLFDLLRVDAEVDQDHSLVDSAFIHELEDLVLGPSELFAWNAAQVLYTTHNCREFPDAVKRLISRGQGKSLRISAALASHLPDGGGQRLMLDRLLYGEITPGCRYLYQSLTAPYGADHLEVVRRGLTGNSVHAATAAAELSKEFCLDSALANELRNYFEQWKGKEEPYSKGGRVVPESPRDELAKILAPAFAQDHDFLIALLADDRSSVQGAAREHALAEAASSALLRSRLLEGVEMKRLPAGLLRTAVLRGLYMGDEAPAIVRFLYSEDARLRYAALPILDVKYLKQEQVRDESKRLLTDNELDIREGASRALHCLTL